MILLFQEFIYKFFVDDEGNAFATDLESTNGSYVNGVKMIEPVKLNPYDILRVGNSLVNWKDFISSEISAQDAYKTIVDEERQEFDQNIKNEHLNQKNNELENNNSAPNKKRKEKPIIWNFTFFIDSSFCRCILLL